MCYCLWFLYRCFAQPMDDVELCMYHCGMKRWLVFICSCMFRNPFVFRLVGITVTPRLLGSALQSWLAVRGVQLPSIAVRGIARSHRLLPRHVDLGPRVHQLHRSIPPSGRGLLVAEADLLLRSVPDLDLGVLLPLARRLGSRRPLRRTIQHP